MQSNPPKPSNPDVYVEHLDAFEAFVGSFSGWNTVKSITEHASELYHVLGENGEEADSEFFYSVGYDSPFRLLDRHNEVRPGTPVVSADDVCFASVLSGHHSSSAEAAVSGEDSPLSLMPCCM